MSAPVVCRHCGWFIVYVIPKAPANPSWTHTLYRPDPPTNDQFIPCGHPEPER